MHERLEHDAAPASCVLAARLLGPAAVALHALLAVALLAHETLRADRSHAPTALRGSLHDGDLAVTQKGAAPAAAARRTRHRRIRAGLRSPAAADFNTRAHTTGARATAKAKLGFCGFPA